MKGHPIHHWAAYCAQMRVTGQLLQTQSRKERVF